MIRALMVVVTVLCACGVPEEDVAAAEAVQQASTFTEKRPDAGMGGGPYFEYELKNILISR